MIEWILIGLLALAILLAFTGIRTIRPTQRAIVETFGKFTSVRYPGLNWIIPFFQRMIYINITEQMSNIEPQEVITKDNLNCSVDLVIFYKIKKDDESVKNALYAVNNVDSQLETLARTTARNVIGTLPFREVNSERNELNKRLQTILIKETVGWGVEVLKVELKDIMPPKLVQESMNKVIQSENEKDASINLANSAENVADGKRRASIKEAEGLREAKKIVADGEAYRLKTVNNAANQFFKGNAITLRKLDVTESALKDNAKVVLTEKGIQSSIILGDIPIKSKD